ncbi:MAG: DUF6519 domain-containing protein [Pseudomonadota bacterium]
MHGDSFTKSKRGEFRGDFSRDTFDPQRHFSRVLMQQGRVQLDADWNEQTSILVHGLRSLGVGLMGPHAAPNAADGSLGRGFRIAPSDDGADFAVEPGPYYVDGILCDNDDESLTFRTQQHLPSAAAEADAWADNDGDYLVYLDVWERHVSYVEDDYIREKALAGPDTASRAQVVWQVKVLHEDEMPDGSLSSTLKADYDAFLAALAAAGVVRPGTGLLRARARQTEEDSDEPCLTSPEAQYRGAENQLYRVEIHSAGTGTSDTDAGVPGPTFKWSRENGSVVFPIVESQGDSLILEHLGRDCRFGLQPGDWVEMADDDYILGNRAEPLLQVESVDPELRKVTFKEGVAMPAAINADKHPYLRRWDQRDGDASGITVVEGNDDRNWIRLEDGVEIQFPAPPDNAPDHRYQTGDYWLIPARTSTRDVEWPGPAGDPAALPPQGVDHHYAPLRLINVDSNGVVSPVGGAGGDLRRRVMKIWK